jgi:hypothetical protein
MAKVNFIAFEDEETMRRAAIVAQKKLIDDNNIEIPNDAAIPTIAAVYMESLFTVLADNINAESEKKVNFAGLMNVGYTHRDSEDGEKEGNYTPLLEAGIKIKRMIKSDANTESDD